MIKLSVQEMMCGGCVKSITEALKTLDDKTEVFADIDTGSVEVTSSADAETVRKTIEEAGFPAKLV